MDLRIQSPVTLVEQCIEYKRSLCLFPVPVRHNAVLSDTGANIGQVQWVQVNALRTHVLIAEGSVFSKIKISSLGYSVVVHQSWLLLRAASNPYAENSVHGNRLRCSCNARLLHVVEPANLHSHKKL